MVSDSFASAMDWAAASLGQPGSLVQTTQHVVDVVVAVVPGVDYASVTMLSKPDRRLSTTASTHNLVTQLDALQYELHEGPCYDAVSEGAQIMSEDLGRDLRWPTFGLRADQFGIRSQAALPLLDDSQVRIGLNLYSKAMGGLHPSAIEEAQVIAGFARIALGYSREIDHLIEALVSRSKIGTAIGIVMVRYGMDNSRAFDYLTRLSQTSNTKLRDIADGIIESAEPSHQQ